MTIFPYWVKYQRLLASWNVQAQFVAKGRVLTLLLFHAFWTMSEENKKNVSSNHNSEKVMPTKPIHQGYIPFRIVIVNILHVIILIKKTMYPMKSNVSSLSANNSRQWWYNSLEVPSSWYQGCWEEEASAWGQRMWYAVIESHCILLDCVIHRKLTCYIKATAQDTRFF